MFVFLYSLPIAPRSVSQPQRHGEMRCRVLSPGENWHHARAAAHDNLLVHLRDCLITGPRSISVENVHLESAVRTMPLRYGFETKGPNANLTPDIIAFDDQSCEILVIEATICPDAALPRYLGRKRAKYRHLCARAKPELPLRVVPPLVVAVGTSGALPEGSRTALAEVLGLELENGSGEGFVHARASKLCNDAPQRNALLLQSAIDAIGDIGRTRPDGGASAAPPRRTRSERRRRGRERAPGPLASFSLRWEGVR